MSRFTPQREIDEHLDLALHADLSDTEKDERLDAALQCACDVLLDALEPGWQDLRRELESVTGLPYIYIYITGKWIMLSPLFAEVRGDKRGYALAPVIPSSSLLVSQLAREVDRVAFCRSILNEDEVQILIITAYAPPVAFEHERDALLFSFKDAAENHEDDLRTLVDTLPRWGSSINRVTSHHVRANRTYSNSIPAIEA